MSSVVLGFFFIVGGRVLAQTPGRCDREVVAARAAAFDAAAAIAIPEAALRAEIMRRAGVRAEAAHAAAIRATVVDDICVAATEAASASVAAYIAAFDAVGAASPAIAQAAATRAQAACHGADRATERARIAVDHDFEARRFFNATMMCADMAAGAADIAISAAAYMAEDGIAVHRAVRRTQLAYDEAVRRVAFSVDGDAVFCLAIATAIHAIVHTYALR